VGWLVLTRRERQRILIGDHVVIEVISARWGEAKIAIQAPEEIAIHRQEVRKRIERERGAE
jgi:carbon storage regulator